MMTQCSPDFSYCQCSLGLCFMLITFLWFTCKAECNNLSHILSVFLRQAIERGPTQASTGEQEESSGAAEQGLSEADSMEARGGRFSKSAEERQKMLKQRKEEMIQQARRLGHCWFSISQKEELSYASYSKEAQFKI